jgi:hypothetical protein
MFVRGQYLKAQFFNKSGSMCRALSSAPRTQDSTRVTTKDQTKRRRTDRLVIRVVIGELGPRQPFVTVSHCRRNEVTQRGFKNLVNIFRLPISGCVECRGHAQPDAKQNCDFPLERTRETSITIKNESLTRSLSRPHVIHIQLGEALCCYLFVGGHEERYFREPVNEDTDRIMSSRSQRQLCNKVMAEGNRTVLQATPTVVTAHKAGGDEPYCAGTEDN